MPITHEGKRICEKCGKEFEWVHFEPVREKYGASVYQTESLPRKTVAYSVTKNQDGTYEICVNCKHCDFENRFTFCTGESRA